MNRSTPPARKARRELPGGRVPAEPRQTGAAPPFRFDLWDALLIATMALTGLPIAGQVLGRIFWP